mmetsp:Transcript_43254/g.70184  ORF Transcript_43254/g.70184 Transcript_43254/m.70184 type:complete len:212 (+) Transcript_43254:642-1277(+)
MVESAEHEITCRPSGAKVTPVTAAEWALTCETISARAISTMVTRPSDVPTAARLLLVAIERHVVAACEPPPRATFFGLVESFLSTINMTGPAVPSSTHRSSVDHSTAVNSVYICPTFVNNIACASSTTLSSLTTLATGNGAHGSDPGPADDDKGKGRSKSSKGRGEECQNARRMVVGASRRARAVQSSWEERRVGRGRLQSDISVVGLRCL